MVPLWFLPFAVATGNTFIVKPSEQVPLSQRLMFELLEQCDLPPGVVNLVNGGRDVVEAICDHPGIRAVSFVGSTPVAQARLPARRRTRASACRRSAARRTSSSSCRTPTSTARSTIITESFFGCAGERCLAGSVLLPVGDGARARRASAWSRAAKALKVGDGARAGRRRWAR